ncbi:SHOCT domain-containing protein [Patescibacteria group bacterium]|nr:SHOCT domain-containing protein [Patescibacteria group bacterium]MDE1946339.1 SHOCT domain-containing protein [Patescibacteria group bacterium]MDE2010791.1 SHOCT domain-containing protein [Patescibacteria group bacterium]MDE2232676.1 SHOCT domain-containing protein [Patescibacteria group bacterium]
MWNGFWPWSVVGGLVQVLIVVFIIMVIVRVVRHERCHGWKGSSAEEVLKERFAKGEITKEEYEEKLKVIRG